MKNKWQLIIVLFIGVSLGAVLSNWWFQAPVSANTTIKTPTKRERKIKYWVAPMDPSYRRDKPGKSPMGMDLVPVYESAQQDDKEGITLSPRVVNNLGVVTAKARVSSLAREINTVGYVAANQDSIETVHSYIDGWIRDLRVTAIGDAVKKGQVLFKLYSPSLVNAQQEYTLALNNNNRQLIKAGHKKLLTLGLTEKQIKRLSATRRVKQQLAIYANTDGVLSNLAIRDGMYIKPDKELMVIEDLSSVWIRVEVYENQADWVKKNQIAVATLPGLPGRQWQGEVIYVYPTLNKTTHTLAVRLQFPNPNLTLKPGMYAAVKIFIPASKKALVIPEQAVITTEKGSHVILAMGDGRFKPENVILGQASNGLVAINKGLKPDDEVVVSGQFLIDSESNLNAAFTRMEPHKMQHHTHHHKYDEMFEATILAINPKTQRITVSHKPIAALNMPEMVMELPVKPGIDLSSYAKNQRVKIKLLETSPNHYQVIAISPITNEESQ